MKAVDALQTTIDRRHTDDRQADDRQMTDDKQTTDRQMIDKRQIDRIPKLPKVQRVIFLNNEHRYFLSHSKGPIIS